MSEKRWIIWSNRHKHTGVVTDNKQEAHFCADGIVPPEGLSTHLYDFIDNYGEDMDEFVFEEIEVDP